MHVAEEAATLDVLTGGNYILGIALIEEVRFARDSPLEEAGFEPSVPGNEGQCFETTCRPLGDQPLPLRWTDALKEDRRFEFFPTASESINSAALGEQAPLHRRRWSRSRLKIDAFFASIVQGPIQPLRDGQPGEKVIGSAQDAGLGAFIRKCPAKLG